MGEIALTHIFNGLKIESSQLVLKLLYLADFGSTSKCHQKRARMQNFFVYSTFPTSMNSSQILRQLGSLKLSLSYQATISFKE